MAAKKGAKDLANDVRHLIEDVSSEASSGKGMKVKQVDINELTMDEYQRITNDAQVERIAKSFDPVKAGLIVVSERDGKQFLVDGGHRVAAMRKKQITFCPAIVLYGLTEQEEADYFRKQGENTRNLTVYDRYKAGLVAGDPVCLEIEVIVKKHDFAVSSSSSAMNRIRAVQTLQRIHRQYGAGTLDKTLMLIRQTWDGFGDITKPEYLLGTAEFVFRFGAVDFVGRFKKMSFSNIHNRYLALKESQPKGRAFCMALVQRYNEGINGKKKLVMGYDD